VARFWGTDRVASKPGLKAVDLFDAVAAGKIKALWIMATNPVDSMPEADKVRAAIRACPFVVVSDMSARTDTGIEAHIRLPAAGWGEKDGTVTNSERRISRQRPFLPLPGEARPDWWIVTHVARRMGFADAFPYRNAGEIFAEHVALSAFENGGTRDFDLTPFAGLDYDSMAPRQWGSPRMFSDGKFFTPSTRARFVEVTPPPPLVAAPGMLLLNTGRVRDHWHTMTRTGKTARLSAHMAEPFVEIHPDDADTYSIKRATLVRLENRHGSAVVRALITDRQRKGSVFVPMHWTGQFSSAGRIDALVRGQVDPVSGQPALKMAQASIAPAGMRWYGFAVAATTPALDGTDYWALAQAEGGVRIELGWENAPGDWESWVRNAFGIAEGATLLTLADSHSGRRSFALFEDDRLVFALYLSPEPVLVSRQWAVSLLAHPPERRADALAGRPGLDRPDGGAIVCACFQVGINSIGEAIANGCHTVEAVGAALKAGTNCGSCRSEIRSIIAARLKETTE
jgi:assimilatory nitrate reductase catalytic subunit